MPGNDMHRRSPAKCVRFRTPRGGPRLQAKRLLVDPHRELLWLRRLRDLTRAFAQEVQRATLIERVLDAALELTDAQRGFLVLAGERGFAVHTSRGIGRAELEEAADPSRRVVQRALSEGSVVTSRERDVELLNVTSLAMRSVSSVAAVALSLGGRPVGALYLETHAPEHRFSSEDLPILETFAEQAALALEFVDELREGDPHAPEATLVGSSLAMDKLRALIERVGASSEHVLITGESGSGKELAARALHEASQRGRAPHERGPFLAESCGALSSSLWESELFGHVRGAFSGADADREGLFVLAGRGTLLLDEVADFPLGVQAKLLRALQEREVRPLGSSEAVPVRCRVVATTRFDLRALVAEGRFREDLFYRLDVLRVPVPPLRERPEDIPALVAHFSAARGGKPRISKRALELLQAWHWPGNVRELAHELERLHALDVEEVTTPQLGEHLRSSAGLARTPELAGKTLGQAERVLVEEALETAGGNKARAARILGVSRPSFYRLLDRHGLR